MALSRRNKTKQAIPPAQKEAIQDSRRIYFDFLKAAVGGLNLRGIKIVIDCAFGANCSFAPAALKELGSDVVSLNDSPDGTNINLNCL